MSRPSVVLFDVMETLVEEPFFTVLPEFFGMSLEELIREKHPTSWRDFEKGLIDEETYFKSFFNDGREVDGHALKEHMRRAYRWIDGMEELVQRLRKDEVPLYALSNYSDWYRMIDEKLGLSRYMSWDFVSCKTGLRKPNPEVYTRVARELKLSPAECLFVDDRIVNCESAARIGMRAIVFKGAAHLEAELRAQGFRL